MTASDSSRGAAISQCFRINFDEDVSEFHGRLILFFVLLSDVLRKSRILNLLRREIQRWQNDVSESTDFDCLGVPTVLNSHTTGHEDGIKESDGEPNL